MGGRMLRRRAFVVVGMTLLACAGAFFGCGVQGNLPGSCERIAEAQDLRAAAEEDDARREEEFQRVLDEHLARQNVPESDIPVAFEAAREKNPDVVAWLWVPDTNVNVPVCRRDSDRYYYMRHDADGETITFGAAFLERGNAADFTDPVTVVYGHSLVDADLLFTQLHRFEDPGFAQEHDEFRVYLLERILTYRIASAEFTDDAGILSEVDMLDSDGLQVYFDGIGGGGAGLDASSDRVLHLSTCDVPPVDGQRYVVTGVLVEEEPF